MPREGRKSGFLRTLFDQEGNVDFSQAKEAWASAGNEDELGYTNYRRIRDEYATKKATPAAKKAAKTAATKAEAETATTAVPSTLPSLDSVIDHVDEHIDIIMGTINDIPALGQAVVDLRKFRRLIYSKLK